MQRSEARQRLSCRSLLTLRTILRHDSGISTRHFAVPDIDRVFSLTPDCPDCDLAASRQVLRECGNLSRPSVLFALGRALRDGSPDERGDWWLTSFGACFSAHGCRVGL